jgi:hypothetical protein
MSSNDRCAECCRAMGLCAARVREQIESAFAALKPLADTMEEIARQLGELAPPKAKAKQVACLHWSHRPRLAYATCLPMPSVTQHHERRFRRHDRREAIP